MKEIIRVAKAILLDRDGRVLIYLRDDKPTIPFPNQWDLIGGMVEARESALVGLLREVAEEIGVELTTAQPIEEYATPQNEHFTIFWAQLDAIPSELTLTEGQSLTSIDLSERSRFHFAGELGNVLDRFADSRGNDNQAG